MIKDVKLCETTYADAPKTTSKRATEKTAEATGDSIGNKIGNKIKKISKYPQRNISVTVTNEDDKEIPKKSYISPEKMNKIIDDLRLV